MKHANGTDTITTGYKVGAVVQAVGLVLGFVGCAGAFRAHSCAIEGGVCACNGKVKFGLGDAWSEYKNTTTRLHGYKNTTTRLYACTSDEFGDPVSGSAGTAPKVCLCVTEDGTNGGPGAGGEYSLPANDSNWIWIVCVAVVGALVSIVPVACVVSSMYTHRSAGWRHLNAEEDTVPETKKTSRPKRTRPKLTRKFCGC